METAGLIVEALEILKRHPMIGRPAEAGARELVLSRGRSDLVVVLSIRHQREAGFLEQR